MRKPKRQTILLLLLLVLLLLPVVGLLDYVLPHKPELSEFGNITGIEFPQSAVLAESQATAFSQQWYAKIRMKKNDLEAFLDRLSSFSEISTTAGPRSLVHLKAAWWNPDMSKEFVYVVSRPQGHFLTQLLIFENGSEIIVYAYHSQ